MISPGAFDIVCEICPHIAIVLYRLYPENHHFLHRLFLFAAITTFVGTIAETIVIFYMFGSLWSQWQLAFKIVTPLLHVAFSATQLHGSRIFMMMYLSQKRKCRDIRRVEEVEKGLGNVLVITVQDVGEAPKVVEAVAI